MTGADVTNVKREDAGRVLSDTVRCYMSDLAVDNGLKAVGYSTDDIPALVKATLPQVTFYQQCRHGLMVRGQGQGLESKDKDL